MYFFAIFRHFSDYGCLCEPLQTKQQNIFFDKVII